MHISWKIAALLAFNGALAACQQGVAVPAEVARQTPPAKVRENPITPESLIDVSTEVVNVNLSTREHLAQLTQLITRDPPSRADLGCAPENPVCKDARKLLDMRGIPVQFTGDAGAALVYERVIARDCDDRSQGSQALGCASSANIVQMVGDKRQFVSPTLMDFPDAEKAVGDYGDKYLNLPPALPSHQ